MNRTTWLQDRRVQKFYTDRRHVDSRVPRLPTGATAPTPTTEADN